MKREKERERERVSRIASVRCQRIVLIVIVRHTSRIAGQALTGFHEVPARLSRVMPRRLYTTPPSFTAQTTGSFSVNGSPSVFTEDFDLSTSSSLRVSSFPSSTVFGDPKPPPTLMCEKRWKPTRFQLMPILLVPVIPSL